MAKKEPVNLTVQTIYIFMPILSLFALYRVEKLRLGILISILFSMMSWGIDYGFGVDDGADLELAYFGEHLDYLVIVELHAPISPPTTMDLFFKNI